VQDLLQHFGISNKSLAFADEFFEQPLCVCSMGMMRTGDDAHQPSTWGYSNRPESWMLTSVVTALDLFKEAANVYGRIFVSCGRTDYIELLACIS